MTGLPRRIPAALAYPIEWLRGWAAILSRAPRLNSEPMPRIDIIPGVAEVRGLAGRYLVDDHIIRLYPDEDREDALCTLIHELAHAWAPYERAHHGPRWRETYADLVEWLTGWRPNLDAIANLVREGAVTRLDGSRARATSNALGWTLDNAITDLLRDLQPTTTLLLWTDAETGARPVVAAAIGSRRHRIDR